MLLDNRLVFITVSNDPHILDNQQDVKSKSTNDAQAEKNLREEAEKAKETQRKSDEAQHAQEKKNYKVIYYIKYSIQSSFHVFYFFRKKPNKKVTQNPENYFAW